MIAILEKQHNSKLIGVEKPNIYLQSQQEAIIILHQSPPSLNVRKIGKQKIQSNFLTKLKKTWIGNIYKTYFKKIQSIKLLVNFIILIARRVYISINLLKYRDQTRRRIIVKLRDFTQNKNLLYFNIFDSIKVLTPAPKMSPQNSQVSIGNGHDCYLFPSVYISEITNSIIYGGSNLVFSGDIVICHDLYDFASDYTSEELHGRHLINIKKMYLRLLRQSNVTPEKIAVAASFVDACAPNYAHWMTETLPRIASFCSVKEFKNIPLIVDDNLHPNIMQSLAFIVGSGREVIVLKAENPLYVDKLLVTSVTGYTPFDRRNKKNRNHSHGLFHPSSLSLICERLFFLDKNLPLQSHPKKIYLRRLSAYRKLVNEIEVEELLKEKGYLIIEPEKFTFFQQVLIFKNAEKIIGPSGSAWGNLIFVSPTAICHILIGKNDLVNYWYWQNIACSTGKVVSYILGDLLSPDDGVHGDFQIDLNDLHLAIAGD